MTNARLLFAILTTAVVGQNHFVAADEPTISRKAIDDRVAVARLKWDVPGLALVLVRDGQPPLAVGYGVKRLGEKDPITADTLFPLASCTKAFSAALLAGLADDGKLDWDDPVSKHLPSYRLLDPAADSLVTLRDLVTHRTGYAGNEHDYLWYRAPWNLNEVLRRASKLEPNGPFRASYHYSSIQFIAAGRAAANRADKPWDELLRERICTPLGMTGVAFTTAEANRSRDRALGHQRTKEGKIAAMPAYEMKEPNPSGSLHASARDLGHWLRFQLDDGKVNGKAIVSVANLNQTKTPHTIMPKDATVGPVYPDSVQVSYAMGWVVYDYRGELVVAHGGVIDGFRVQVTLLPKRKIGFALLNNLHQTRMNIALGNDLIDLLCGLPAKDWNAYYLKLDADEKAVKVAALKKRNDDRKAEMKPSLALEKFAGEYVHPAYEIGKVTFEDGKLQWEWGSTIAPLEHFESDSFRVTSGFLEDQLVAFETADGRATGVRAMGVAFQRK